jgi:ABC-type branched-subunit amino acid transport system permease subunit
MVLYLLSEIIRYMAKFSVLPQAIRGILTEYSYLLLAYGIFLAIFVIFMPRGIVGLFSKERKPGA